MPRYLARDVEILSRADGFASNPKLMRLVGEDQVQTSAARLLGHLKRTDALRRKHGVWPSLAGSFGLTLAVLLIALVSILSWRGFL